MKINSMDDCPHIIGFIKHIFGEHQIRWVDPETGEWSTISNWVLGLDYIQLLIQSPSQKLPALLLISSKNNTGKSTFGKFLKQLFGPFCVMVRNSDLSSYNNRHWVRKLLVICDEPKIDEKEVIRRVKYISTAKKIMHCAVGREPVEIDCFLRFIFMADKPVASSYDHKFWEINLSPVQDENPTFLQDKLIPEIPAFLSFLEWRKLATVKSRSIMWFHPMLYNS